MLNMMFFEDLVDFACKKTWAQNFLGGKVMNGDPSLRVLIYSDFLPT